MLYMKGLLLMDIDETFASDCVFLLHYGTPRLSSVYQYEPSYAFFDCNDSELPFMDRAIKLVRRVLSPAFASTSMAAVALLNPSISVEPIAHLDIPDGVEVQVDLAPVEGGVLKPHGYVLVSGVDISVNIQNKWHPLFLEGGDVWKQSEGYRVIMYSLYLLYKTVCQ